MNLLFKNYCLWFYLTGQVACWGIFECWSSTDDLCVFSFWTSNTPLWVGLFEFDATGRGKQVTNIPRKHQIHHLFDFRMFNLHIHTHFHLHVLTHTHIKFAMVSTILNICLTLRYSLAFYLNRFSQNNWKNYDRRVDAFDWFWRIHFKQRRHGRKSELWMMKTLKAQIRLI